TAAVLLSPTDALGQCAPIDFEDLPLGTLITTQYPGVTFSAFDNDCGTVDLYLGTPTNGTSSGTRALLIEDGCFEFSEEWIRMDFDNDQSLVEFTMGDPIGPGGIVYNINAYNSGGGLVSTQSITSGPGVRTYVRVGSSGGPTNIARIDLLSPISFSEGLDDLRFSIDDTPPIAEIDSPGFLSCACGVISIIGTANDPDGTYEQDWLHYRKVNADPIDPWILIGSFVAPAVGTLYTWDTSSIPHGTYYLRLTVRNVCGMESSDVTAVRVDHNPPSLNIASPFDGETVCGEVCFEGSASDPCMSGWSLEYRAVGTNDPWTTINTGNGTEHCKLGVWDTVTDGIADGQYEIRLYAIDLCGNEAELIITVAVDNSGWCECTPDIDGNGVVDVEDLLDLLAAWGTVFP
ncbi:MAG: hypothetical protein O7G85_03085, partial [Planctomycetota bacterium]|nr:hypothetical protein [Planctomycetota bacterium]